MCQYELTLCGSAPIQTVSISFFRFPSLTARLWVLGQMGAARLAFRKMPGVRFWKLCGSGKGEGFLPIPNTEVWAILAVWDDAGTARERTADSPVYRRWRAKASEAWTVFLSCASARGKWSGVAPFTTGSDAEAPCAASGPIAILTRATLKPRALPGFWSKVPDVETLIGGDRNVIFKIGIGEVPWLHQITFSIWPDHETMTSFAHRDGAHLRAIRAVRDGDWFREELYARFRVVGSAGTWDGRCPLDTPERIAA